MPAALCMQLHVLAAVVRPAERLGAPWKLARQLFVGVRPFVAAAVGRPRKLPAAHCAGVRLLPRVHPHVCLHVVFAVEHFVCGAAERGRHDVSDRRPQNNASCSQTNAPHSEHVNVSFSKCIEDTWRFKLALKLECTPQQHPSNTPQRVAQNVKDA